MNVYVCVGCGLLDHSERSDQLTCSNKCRVRAHRNGSLKRLRALAKSYEITPASIQQAAAVQRLAPHISDQVMARTIRFERSTAQDLASVLVAGNETDRGKRYMSVTPNDYHHRAEQHRPTDNATLAKEVHRLALLGWRVRDIAAALHLHPHLVVLLLDRVVSA